jgi:hypothetical protein
VATLIADKRPKAELIEKVEKHDVNETKYVAEEKDYVEETESRSQTAPGRQLHHDITEEFGRIDKKKQSEGEPGWLVGALRYTCPRPANERTHLSPPPPFLIFTLKKQKYTFYRRIQNFA